MIPLALMAVIVVVLSVKQTIDLFVRGDAKPASLARGLDAILFWGAFAAVLGFLGQCYGIYNAMKAIGQAGQFSPSVTAYGFFISFTSTMLGLGVLVVAAFCWYVLRFWSRRVERSLAAT